MRLKPMHISQKLQIVLLSLGLLLFSGQTFGVEFSAGVGALHNAKMSFTSPSLNMTATPLATSNPGSDDLTSFEDRTYDDGFVKDDGRVGAPYTKEWGYDNFSAQVVDVDIVEPDKGRFNQSTPNDIANGDGDRIEMTSLQSSTFFSESERNDEVDADADNSIFLNMDFPVHKGSTFSWGVRAGLSYTRMEGDQSEQVEGLQTDVTIVDSYALAMGSPSGMRITPANSHAGNIWLWRNPTDRMRTNEEFRVSLSREQEMELDMVAFDLGLYGAYSPFKRLKLHLAGGLSVMHVHSVLAYRNEWNGEVSSGKKSENQLLLGANIQGGATVKFDPDTEKGFGLFGNVTYRRMEEFKTEVDGYEAALDFDDAVQFSVGMNYVF